MGRFPYLASLRESDPPQRHGCARARGYMLHTLGPGVRWSGAGGRWSVVGGPVPWGRWSGGPVPWGR